MMQSGLPAEQQKYTGTVDCFTKILQQEKITGFFKGNMANVIDPSEAQWCLFFMMNSRNITLKTSHDNINVDIL